MDDELLLSRGKVGIAELLLPGKDRDNNYNKTKDSDQYVSHSSSNGKDMSDRTRIDRSSCDVLLLNMLEKEKTNSYHLLHSVGQVGYSIHSEHEDK